MREIKFRLIFNGEIVGCERHAYCGYGVSLFHSVDGQEWFNIEFGHYILHDDKNQYTGRKDNNDKEIYESDICNILRYDKKTWEVVEVIWMGVLTAFGYRGYYGSKTTSDYYGLRTENIMTREIIGNMYKNKELLE